MSASVRFERCPSLVGGQRGDLLCGHAAVVLEIVTRHGARTRDAAVQPYGKAPERHVPVGGRGRIGRGDQGTFSEVQVDEIDRRGSVERNLAFLEDLFLFRGCNLGFARREAEQEREEGDDFNARARACPDLRVLARI